jgi:hypothetical protein
MIILKIPFFKKLTNFIIVMELVYEIWNIFFSQVDLKLTSLSKMGTIIVFGTRRHEEEACEGFALSLFALVKVHLIFD